MIFRPMYYLVQEKCQVSWAHVRGPSGHPWNELVDIGSKMASRGELGNLPRASMEVWAISVPHAAWSWLLEAPSVKHRQYPPIVKGTFYVAEPMTAAEPECIFQPRLQTTKQHVMPCGGCHIKARCKCPDVGSRRAKAAWKRRSRSSGQSGPASTAST
jgi:hypothetical protein